VFKFPIKSAIRRKIWREHEPDPWGGNEKTLVAWAAFGARTQGKLPN